MSFKEQTKEVLASVLPLTFFVLILQILFLNSSIQEYIVYSIGSVLTIIGFTLFIVGAEKSLLYFGEITGTSLIKQSKLWLIILVTISLGFATTIAEPGVQLFATQTEVVKSGLLSKYLLIIVISLGVGISLCLAVLRLIFNISLKKIIIGSYILAFTLVLIANPKFIALAFDASGVTTGPVSVPFILALGFGITSLKGIKKSSDDNFGFVALASIGPILAILILGVIF